MFSDIQFCHSVFLQESEKYLKKSIDILSISASQLLSYLYIYICFVFSLECKNGGLDRWFSATLGGPGGRNRAWRPSPSSARFSLLVSFLISAALTYFCRLSASFSHHWCNSFSICVLCPFLPPPKTVHSPPIDSHYHFIFIPSLISPLSSFFSFFFYHFFSSFIPCNALSKGILTFKVNFVLCYICCEYA